MAVSKSNQIAGPKYINRMNQRMNETADESPVGEAPPTGLDPVAPSAMLEPQEPRTGAELALTYSALPSVRSKGDSLDRRECSWADLIVEYREWAQTEHDPDSVWVHNLVEFEEGRRSGDAAIRAYGVIIETDSAAWTIEEVQRVLRQNGLMAAIYTTKSHTPEEPRYRIVVPLAEAIPADRYGRVVRFVEALLGGRYDASARRPTQFQRMPTFGANIYEVDGSPLDPARVPGATDYGEPLVPPGLRLFAPSSGPTQLGPVATSDPPKLVQAVLAPERTHTLTELQQVAGVLGQVCVCLRDEYYVRLPTGKWVYGTRPNALSLLNEHWSQPVGADMEIEPKQIEMAFRGNLIPTVQGVLASPVAAEFVQFQGQRYLNKGLAPRVPPSEFGQDGRQLLEFIVRNICADDRDLDVVMREACQSVPVKRSTATRWVLHWIASQYQSPGIPQLTALWVISLSQGVGKTLFADLLRDLLGRPNTTAANAAEFKGDWNNWLVGVTLVVADEINVIERASFYATIKRWVANPTIAIRQRNVGQYEIPSTATFLFLTNEYRPIALDGGDRRHMMIEATNDLTAANAVIDGIRPILSDPKRRMAAIAQLGAWLDQIEVDSALLARALHTELKDEVIDTTRSPTERWLIDFVECGRWAIGQFVAFDQLFGEFEAWAELNGIFKGSVESAKFQSGLQVAKRRGWLRDDRKRVPEMAADGGYQTTQKRGWVLVKLPPDVSLPERGELGLLDRARAKKQASPAIERLRRKASA